jgi:hypothetical protein
MEARRLQRFIAMTVARKRLIVKPTPMAQAQARALVAAGMVAYEDRAGRIRSLGAAVKPDDAGRVIRTSWTTTTSREAA